MKRVYDKEMEKTQKSMEKAFFSDMTDKNKTCSYDKYKQRLKRELKRIEGLRFVEGQKYENLSGVFPEKYKGLKNERNDKKSNFEKPNGKSQI